MAKKQKKVRKNVIKAIAHVQASFNNTYINITDMSGETLAWKSAGTIGFKGSRKSTPYAATRAAEEAASLVKKMVVSDLEFRVKGAGAGRESAITALQNAGLKITAVEDRTPIPHNGCRPPKRRRV